MFNSDFQQFIDRKVIERDNIVRKREEIKNKKIVFSNGVFDLLHPGHLDYLYQAKLCGDILWLGVNEDKSVTKLKGKARPVNELKSRLSLLCSLNFVDYVSSFSEANPVELIKLIKPHVHIKGGDYKIEDMPETPVLKSLGAEIKIIKLLEGYSSTAIIEKIFKNE